MRISAVLAITLMAILTLAASASCAVVYVNLNSPNNGPGNDWDHAYRTVAAGLTAAVSGGEVWVARGTYTEAITLTAGAALYGGFVGTETAREQRNWAANPTILNGIAGGPTVTSPRWATLTTRIDGFTIRNGWRGIVCAESSPTIANNTITANHYYMGAGIYCCCSSSPAIIGNLITANTSDDYGGGIYCESSHPVIANNRIVANTARTSGGGIFLNNGSSGTIANNIFAANHASTAGGAIYCSYSSPAIKNNTITANSSTSGAIFVVASSPGSPVIADSIIAFNSSGLYVSGGTPMLTHNCVYGNTLYNYSGYFDHGITDPTGTNGNISADPSFAGQDYGNWHIQTGSPCMDAGENSLSYGASDIDGQARVQPVGGRIDIGADESDSTTWPAGPYVVVRVSPSGNDTNDGSSWDAAKRTVQAGIDAAAALGGDVWVRAGTYNERILLNPLASVYGGFAGAETEKSQRNWNSNVTVLDGQLGGSVVRAFGGHRIGALDGFTITRGSAQSGGGIYLNGASPRIANNRIVNNVAVGVSPSGGGIYCDSSWAEIINNAVSGNVAPTGGGIYCTLSFPTIANNRVTGNSATAGHGGGILVTGGTSATVANNLLMANSASLSGGGLYCSAPSATVSNNTIVQNTAASGGALYISGLSQTLANSIIAFNSSGLNKSSGTPTLSHNCVFGNAAYNYSGIADPTGTNGNISADPKLASIGYGSSQIQPDSPCREAGDNSLLYGLYDIDGQARIQPSGGTVDIGADESDGTTPPIGPYVIVRVSSSGDDSNDGLSWAAAKRTVQAGIESASAQGGDVWVKAGTYYERIILRPFVSIYGGFAGAETERTQRDWNANVTTLDGQKGGTVVTASAPYQTGAIDGFTITNGNASGGGGIYASGSSPTIANNKVLGNTASSGGGICCASSSATITNNMITGNNASAYGGGVYCGSSSPAMANNTIVANSASDGGAIYITGASSAPSLSNTVLAFNSSGVYVSSGSVVLRSNCVYRNSEYNYSGVTDPTGTVGNISVDPKLDYRNWHIQPDSPCIGAGDNSLAHSDHDVDGQPRIQPNGGTADIGADESDGTLWSWEPYVVIRVSTDGDDSNDGLSWATAKRTVQAGIDAGATSSGEVWVKAGTYQERIALRTLVSVYGGFAGAETEKTQRDSSANVTVLDGQQGGSVVTIVSILGDFAIDGFTIKNGNGTVMGGSSRYGGGISCSNSSPTVSNCTITNNQATYGGGMYCVGGFPHISRNVITHNSVGYWGGGIDCENSSLTIIEGNIISYNTSPSYFAAGIELIQSSAVITGNRIEYNTARWSSAGIDTNLCSPTISNNIIRGNVVTNDQLNSYGGGAGLWTQSGSPLVTNNTFIDNRTGSKGGAIFLNGTTGTFANNIFAFNSSGIYGKSSIGSPVVKNNCFYGNTGYNTSGLTTGTAPILLDPLLADWPNGDYHLTVASPCINNGWNGSPGMQPVDLDGEARINRGIVDIGADECWLVPGTLADAKMAASGAKVFLGQTVVSADFPDSFYLESDQRISGIRVEEPAHSLDAGMRADVAGVVMTTDDGEKYIDAITAAQSPGPNDTGWVSPLMFNNRTLGGVGTRAFQLVKTGDVWVRQLVDVSGLNNVGLLVTTFGKVVWTDTNCFYLSDGSMSDDFLTPDPINNQPPGVKVLMPAGATLPQVGSHVVVTGVSSCYKADSIVFRLLRVSKAEDVSGLAP